MSNNFFDNDGDDFRDNPVSRVDGQWSPDQTNVRPASALVPQKKAAPAVTQNTEVKSNPVQEEFELPEIDMDEEEDYTEILSDARLRLEQGRLYEMIINHDLFEGAVADPIAARFVQNKIRKFAKEQMEIMLGMRQETATVERLEIDFPFNQVEVNVLKKLAFAASKGASENSDNFVPEVKRTTEEVATLPRREGLNKIGGGSSKSVAKKLPPKAATPVARKRPVNQESSLEDLDDGYEPIKKHPSEMTEQELINRNAEAEKRQAGRRTVKSASALPMASYEQTVMLAEQHAVAANQGTLTSRLIEHVKNLPTKQ